MILSRENILWLGAVINSCENLQQLKTASKLVENLQEKGADSAVMLHLADILKNKLNELYYYKEFDIYAGDENVQESYL